MEAVQHAVGLMAILQHSAHLSRGLQPSCHCREVLLVELASHLLISHLRMQDEQGDCRPLGREQDLQTAPLSSTAT